MLVVSCNHRHQILWQWTRQTSHILQLAINLMQLILRQVTITTCMYGMYTIWYVGYTGIYYDSQNDYQHKG